MCLARLLSTCWGTKYRVEWKCESMLLEDLQVFHTFSWLTTKDQRSSQLICETSFVSITGIRADGRNRA